MTRAPALDPAFLGPPLAHRGLHDRKAGVIENSRAACAAAAAAGYGIEIDLQLSADGEAMVFHDDELMRLTAEQGAVGERASEDLGRIALDGGGETIPTLGEILALVDGRVPLLIEAKDQSRALGPVDGRLERRAAALLAGYAGPAAVMSFSAASVATFAKAAPQIARGRTTCAFKAADWPHVSEERRRAAARLDDLAELGCGFISHQRTDLSSERVAEARACGLPVLTWTIRSADEEREARLVAGNITFEGYLPRL